MEEKVHTGQLRNSDEFQTSAEVADGEEGDKSERPFSALTGLRD